MAINANGVGIGGVYSNKEETGFRIYWNEATLGFGNIDFCQFGKSGLIRIDSECMSKEFVKKVLCALVDQATFDNA